MTMMMEMVMMTMIAEMVMRKMMLQHPYDQNIFIPR